MVDPVACLVGISTGAVDRTAGTLGSVNMATAANEDRLRVLNGLSGLGFPRVSGTTGRVSFAFFNVSLARAPGFGVSVFRHFGPA